MTEILSKVINSLGLSPGDIIKKKHGDSPEINAEQFVSAILSTESMPEAALMLNIGEQTINRIVAKLLIPFFGKRTGGGDSWKLVLLKNAELKCCSTCRAILAHSSFTKDKSMFDELDSSCTECKRAINKNYYYNNKDRYHKVYIDEHRAEYVARNAHRRAAKLQATPKWADLEKVKEIYNTCPEGYHVDHEYPLISDWVCGLHVHENLRHLSAVENMRKGNRRINASVVK
jgi:hypothetical protein